MKSLLIALVMLFSVAANAVQEVNSQQIDEAVKSSKTPIIVEIYADWCGVCKNMEPMLEKAEDKFAGKVKLLKINGDSPKNPELQGKISAFPTFLILIPAGQDKVKYKVKVGGFRTQKELNEFVQEVIDQK